MSNELKITVSRSNPKAKKVSVPQYLRDNDWSASIGKLQRKLDILNPQEDTITFDFKKSRWIDPLPLLSLLIEIIHNKKRGITVHVHFPSGDKGPIPNEGNNPYQQSPNRLLLFLAKEGFFSELILYDIDAYVGEDKLDNSIVDKCASLTATPSYADSRLIPIRLFDVPIIDYLQDTPNHADFPARTVEEILDSAEVSLHSRCSVPERRQLLYTLRAVLQEFLHNVQEHAYHTNGFSPAAIYVRYRQGGTKLVSGPGQNFYESCIRLEIDNCERVDRDWLDARPGCLEVFFLDRGIGMVQKFSGKNKASNFGNVMRSTFLDGESSKMARRTEHGGLHLLHNLMNRSNDYVRALNDRTWFGSSVPFNRPMATVAKPTKNLPIEDDGLIGLAYHLRLSWKAPTDEPDTWRRFTQNEVTQVWDELRKPAEACNEIFSWYEQCFVVDDRFRYKEEFPVENPATSMLWLPQRGLMKWDILKKLERIASRLSKKCTLVIADIPTMEAAMYKAAMSQSGFGYREEWPDKFERIVLATNRWTFAYAEHISREDDTHGFTPFHTDEIPNSFKSSLGISLPNLSFRQLVVHWLKWHDSRRFWKEVKVGGRHFLPEKVIWSEDENHEPDRIINGYLDFPGTTHSHFCADLYRNALGRIFGILDERECMLESVDRLADSVVHDIYIHEVYDPPKHDKNNVQKIATGSVLVSGSTLHATGLKLSIHFFIHGDSEYLGKLPSLFHWMPDEVPQEGPPSQARIGKTSAIAPKGWLSIEIPRFDIKEESIGKRHPEKTYEDWQSSGPIIAKLGHWHYEGHHDFLTINIPDAVEDAFVRNGPLAQFLINEILHPLGIKQDQIEIARKEYPATSRPPSILVYRSHPSSERIIDKVLSTLTATARQEIMKWVFPVLPLRMRWGGSTLLAPPRMREEISRALQIRSEAIIFDDAAITGRTIQDLLTSLRALGATKTQVVTIANRLRLPAETSAVTYFWRLDVPTMGRQGVCPLCQALEAAKSLAREIVAPSAAYEDIQQWIRTWSHASPLTEWDSGLDPLPLQHPQTKKYCYRHSVEKHLCEIRLFRSTGLTIHAAEVHAMTASDDYGLKKIREQCNDPEIQIELAASQLLLFGNELDMDIVRDFVIDGLLGPLADLDADSPYGQLAVLTLMRILSSTESKQVREDITRNVRERIDKLISLGHGQILLAYLITQDLADVNDDLFHAGARLLTTRHSDIATKLRSLFRETVTPLGGIHSEPIPVLHKKLKAGTTPAPQLWSSALNSLAKIQDIIKELGLDWAASDKQGSYKDKRDKLEHSLQCAETAIKEKNGAIMDCLQKVQSSLNEVADCYFYRISLNEAHKPDVGRKVEEFIAVLSSIWTEIDWTEVCKEKEIKSTPQPKIKLSSASGTNSKFDGVSLFWLLWHAQLRTIIRDLLTNAMHPADAQKHNGVEILINDPWDKGNSEEAHMWVHVKFTPRSAIISFANGNLDPVLAFAELKNGSWNKTRWNTLTDLGGKIDFDQSLIQENILAVQVHIPYAPYLRHGDATTGE